MKSHLATTSLIRSPDYIAAILPNIAKVHWHLTINLKPQISWVAPSTRSYNGIKVHNNLNGCAIYTQHVHTYTHEHLVHA